jgi:hypothetical protein
VGGYRQGAEVKPNVGKEENRSALTTLMAYRDKDDGREVGNVMNRMGMNMIRIEEHVLSSRMKGC